MRRLPAILTAAMLFAPASIGEDHVFSAAQLAGRMAQMDASRVASLQGYTVMRRYILNNNRFNTHAEMTVRMTYTSPGKKEFTVLSESGAVWVRRHVFRRLIRAELENALGAAHRETRITPDNYNFRLLGTETANGRTCYVLDATPKNKNKYLFRGRVWVDAEDAAVSRIEGGAAQTLSFWTPSVHFVHQYEKLGPYWLAASNVSETEVRIFGQTEIKVEYFDYVINPPMANRHAADPPAAANRSLQ